MQMTGRSVCGRRILFRCCKRFKTTEAEVLSLISTLSAEERGKLIQEVNEQEFANMTGREKRRANKLFTLLDLNKDGTLSRQEFMRWHFMRESNPQLAESIYGQFSDSEESEAEPVDLNGPSPQKLPVEEPSSLQMRQYCMRVGIPFVAFGFLDNSLMIVFGELIDHHIAHGIGFSMLFSAAAGNIIADICGVGFGDFVERGLCKMGLPDPYLSAHALRLKRVRRARTFSSIGGIGFGCFLGMVPLLFM